MSSLTQASQKRNYTPRGQAVYSGTLVLVPERVSEGRARPGWHRVQQQTLSASAKCCVSPQTNDCLCLRFSKCLTFFFTVSSQWCWWWFITSQHAPLPPVWHDWTQLNTHWTPYTGFLYLFFLIVWSNRLIWSQLFEDFSLPVILKIYFGLFIRISKRINRFIIVLT